MALTTTGQTLPPGVTTKEQVKELQRQLGVTADGIWGPKSQAAYETGDGKSSLVPADFKGYLSEFQDLLKAPAVSYTGASRAELQAALRPSYDLAIEGRKEQTQTNKANLAADAYARGMGASTWLSDVSNRQQNAEASDIASLEANFARELQAALQQEKANKLAADQFNATSQAAALQNALGLANNFYAPTTTRKLGKGGALANDPEKLLKEALGTYGTGASAGYNAGNASANLGAFANKYSPEAIAAVKNALDAEFAAEQSEALRKQYQNK